MAKKRDAAEADLDLSVGPSPKRMREDDGTPFQWVETFDASRTWWLYMVENEEGVLICDLLFDPASVTAAEREHIAAFARSNTSVLLDIFNNDNSPESELDEVAGVWCSLPSNAELEKAGIEYVKFAKVIVLFLSLKK